MKRISDATPGEMPPGNAGPVSMRWGIALVLAGLALVGGLAVAGVRAVVVDASGCTVEEERLAAALASLPALGLHPPGARVVKRPYSGCDGDDRIPYAVQGFRHDLTTSRTDVASFYADAARQGGWSSVPASDDEPDGRCFAKQIQETAAQFCVRYSDDRETVTDHDEYEIEITAAYQDAQDAVR
ncbi:hypothetical protein ACQP25_08310 [Microtetraspora malaysiensis]|uniref:hypothetical protein n=1 Tax=Microtetraspora malaysiensis TaxID=161358 RepID=UPI003D8AAE7E